MTKQPTPKPSAQSDLALLLQVLPKRLQRALQPLDCDTLIEVVMDLGRPSEARFLDGTIVELDNDTVVSQTEIDTLVEHIGQFGSDNRAGIPRTLHRISALRNRQGQIIGLTCRVGKLITGTIDCIEDLVDNGKSLLILGRPGSGKTTRLREIAQMLADKSRRRVVVVDTSNEIAGDGDIPHPAVGRARRLQVPHRDKQKDVMIEAVQNHTPEVIIVDEIGTEDEALAARTIAERGVMLVATAHGNTLENIIKNPTLSDLIGGIETVTLGDDEAKRRASQKTVLERAKKPTFDICIEIRDKNTLAIYPDVAEAVDHLLRGWTIFPEIRKIDEDGDVRVLQSDIAPLSLTDDELPSEPFEMKQGNNEATTKLFIYGLSKTFVDRILERLELTDVAVTQHIHDATAIIALRSHCRPGSKIMRVAEDYEIPTYFAKTNTMPQIQRAIRESLIQGNPGRVVELPLPSTAGDETELALQEARQAIDDVLSGERPVELSPRRSYIRRLQHELIEKHSLTSLSVGDEPNRRLKVLPPSKPSHG